MSLSFVQILIAMFIVVKREDFIYLFSAKEPQTLRDLAYDKDKRLGYTVHIKEEEKLVPYLVLTKDYSGQGNVLLLRKYLVDPPMALQEGWKRFYYGHSMADSFMNKEFIHRFSESVQENTPSTELGIKALKPNFEGRHIDKIKRKLFLLSDIDVGRHKDRLRLEDEKNLLYFKRKGDVKEYRLAFLENDPVPYSWWLRTAFATDSVVAKLVSYEGKFGGGGVSLILPMSAQLSRSHLKQKWRRKKLMVERHTYILKNEK